MESHRKGDLTEAIVITELKRREIPVSRPFGDNERYDAIVETPDGRLVRVQIKTGWLSDGVLRFHTRSQHTNASGNVYKTYDDTIDYLLVYAEELDGLFLIGVHEFDVLISLRVEEPHQRHRTTQWAKYFRFDRRWPPEDLDGVRGARPATPLYSQACGALEGLGATICLPRDKRDPNWIIVDHEGAQYRVRGEPGSVREGRIRFRAREKDRVDLFVVYCEETDDTYLIDSESFNSTLTLRLDKPANPNARSNFAEDYILERSWPPEPPDQDQ